MSVSAHRVYLPFSSRKIKMALNRRVFSSADWQHTASKLALLVVLAIIPAACQQVTIGVIYNAMSTPITITYSMRVPKFDVDGSTVCILDDDSHQRPRIRQGKVRRSTGGIAGWAKVDNYMSTETPCEATIQLEPGYSAWVFLEYYCSDFEKTLEGATPEPGFAYLRVQSGDKMVEFTDWEMAKQFQRVNSRLCLFEFHDSEAAS